MRITIDIDGKDIEPTSKVTTALPAQIPEAADAGAGVSDTMGDVAVDDAGGPPAWLLDAVGSAIASGSMTATEEIGSEDAGAGPA